LKCGNSGQNLLHLRIPADFSCPRPPAAGFPVDRGAERPLFVADSASFQKSGQGGILAVVFSEDEGTGANANAPGLSKRQY